MGRFFIPTATIVIFAVLGTLPESLESQVAAQMVARAVGATGATDAIGENTVTSDINANPAPTGTRSTLAAPRPTGPIASVLPPLPPLESDPYELVERAATNSALARVASSQRPAGTPALLVHFTAKTILDQLKQQRDTRDPVYDVVLGTSIQGSAETQTNITPSLIPNRSGIEIMLNIHSNAATSTTGTQGPATAYSVGQTSITGSKSLLLLPNGILTNRASASASIQSQLVDFKWNRPIGERIARQRAAEQKDETERIAASRAGPRAGRQLDRQINRELSKLQAQYRSQMNAMMSRMFAPPAHVSFRSTHNTVVAEAFFENQTSVTPPPSLRVSGESQGAAIQFHRSLMRESTDQLQESIAGRTLQEEDWAQFAAAIPAQSTTNDAAANRDQRKWTLRMAKSYPIHLDFLNNTIFIELRFDSFQVGTSEYPGLRIGATYGLEIEGDKIVLVRQGKLQLKPPKKSAEDIAKEAASESTEDDQPKGRRRGVRQQIFRSLARKRFDPIFAEKLNVGSTRRSIGGNPMTIAKIETSDDWITLQAVME